MGLFSGGGLGSILGGAAGFFLGGPAGAVAGASLGGSIGGADDANQTNISLANSANALQYRMFNEAQDFNSAETAKSREWMEKMSNTAVQRQVADLRRSGINPILAAQYGGASSPSSPAGSVSAPNVHLAKVNDIMTPALHTASDMAKTSSIVSLQKSQQQKVMIEAEKVYSEIDNLQASTSLTREQKLKVSEEIGRVRVEIKNIMENTRGKKQLNDLKQVLTNLVNSAGFAEMANKTGLTIHKLLELATKGIDKLESLLRSFDSKEPDNSPGYIDQFKSWMQNTRKEYENRSN